MVTMKNIARIKDTIFADCYKEGKQDKHFVLYVDASTFEIRECSLDKPSIYARQAAAKIAELVKQGVLPKDALSIWC